MRRSGVAATDGLEILGGGFAVECVVRPVVVEAIGEAVDEGLQLVDTAGQVITAVELVSPGALSPFHGAVELRPVWGQDEEVEVFGLASSLEGGLELRAAVDLECLAP